MDSGTQWGWTQGQAGNVLLVFQVELELIELRFAYTVPSYLLIPPARPTLPFDWVCIHLSIDPTIHLAGDVDEALALVNASDGIARARDVALVQAEKAMDAVLTLRESPARDALVKLAHKIVNRNH